MALRATTPKIRTGYKKHSISLRNTKCHLFYSPLLGWHNIENKKQPSFSLIYSRNCDLVSRLTPADTRRCSCRADEKHNMTKNCFSVPRKHQKSEKNSSQCRCETNWIPIDFSKTWRPTTLFCIIHHSTARNAKKKVLIKNWVCSPQKRILRDLQKS